MYLKTLHISGFRTISELEITFNKRLNVIIGENNAGKTAVIDALRICMEYGNTQKKRYITSEDFHRDLNGKISPAIQFDLTLIPESVDEEGAYYEYLAISSDLEKSSQKNRIIQIHHRYILENKGDEEKLRKKIWGGTSENQYLSDNARDLFECIHVDALRNAEQDMRPARHSLLGSMFRKQISDKHTREIIEQEMHKALDSGEIWNKALQSGSDKVNSLISNMSFVNNVTTQQKIDIQSTELNFEKLVDSSYMILKYNDVDKFRLIQNGLGYNNIIYIATILANLKLKDEMDPTYHALLIEEPESHLHPQLQRTFFDYINKLNEPNIQLFVTSHSPTLTASVDLDSLIVLKKNGEISSTFTAVKSNLKETDKKYLKKFFDVTRNQLFFANGVLLVEGISEELLIGIFAEIMEIEEKIPDKYNLHKHGIEVINVNGVAFNHYAPLFNSDIPENSLNVRAAIITDDDKGTKAPSKRSELAGNKLKVMEGDHTFEYELYKYEKNRPILNIVLGKVIAKYPQELSELLLEAGDNALCFKDFIADKRCKADFALALSIYLQDDDEAKKTFHVPDYIQDAIKWVIIGDGHL